MFPFNSGFKVNLHEIVFSYGTDVLAVTFIVTESLEANGCIGVTNIPISVTFVDAGIVDVSVVSAPSSPEFIP